MGDRCCVLYFALCFSLPYHNNNPGLVLREPRRRRRTDCRTAQGSRGYTITSVGYLLVCCCHEVHTTLYLSFFYPTAAAVWAVFVNFGASRYVFLRVSNIYSRSKSTPGLTPLHACSGHTLPLALKPLTPPPPTIIHPPPLLELQKTHLFSLPVVLESHGAFGEQVMSMEGSEKRRGVQ